MIKSEIFILEVVRFLGILNSILSIIKIKIFSSVFVFHSPLLDAFLSCLLFFYAVL